MKSESSASAARQAGRESIEAYDPKQSHEKELEDMKASITQLRERASAARLGARTVQKQLDKVQTEFKQLMIEDDIAQQRLQAAEELGEMKQQLDHMRSEIEDQEFYLRTLRHMERRLKQEGINRRATIEALEQALRTHKQELRLQQRHHMQARKGARSELDMVK